MIFNTIIYLKETSSTMNIARYLTSFLKPPFIVIAESQSSGRGQRDRKWFSPKGGLWFTEVFQLERILGLSLFISIPILRVLKKYAPNVKVKWPNDLYLNGKKLVGILTEISKNVAFVGVGVNIENNVPEEVKKSAISLKKIKNAKRIKIFKEILKEEEKIFPVFNQKGFAPFRNEYEGCLLFMGKNVTVKSKEIIQGKVLGVSEFGELILKTVDGIKKIIQGTVLFF